MVSYDPETMQLVVKVGNKQKTCVLSNGLRVHDVDGSEMKAKDRADKLRKGTRVDIDEKDGNIVAVNLKK